MVPEKGQRFLLLFFICEKNTHLHFIVDGFGEAILFVLLFIHFCNHHLGQDIHITWALRILSHAFTQVSPNS